MKLARTNTVAAQQREKVEIKIITPEFAERLLERNTSNRNLRRDHVNTLARDMSEGAWRLNNDAICIANDGTLLNGQHRLNAIIKAGKPIKMLVAEGFSPETYKVLDGGAKRSVADQLNITNELAATLKLAFNFSTGSHFQHGIKPNHQDIETLIESDFGKTYDMLPRSIKTISPTSVRVAAIAAILKGVDPAHVILEINSLTTLDFEYISRGGHAILRSLRNPSSMFSDLSSSKARVLKTAYMFKHFQQLDRDVQVVRMSDRQAHELLKEMGIMFKEFFDAAESKRNGDADVYEYAANLPNPNIGFYDYSCGSASEQVAGV
jgi:hypothetical protein